MIITCEKCSTKFNLDESFLNESGSKVRCCLCKHVFTVYPSVKKNEAATGHEKNETTARQPNEQSVFSDFDSPLKQSDEALDDSKGEIDKNFSSDDLETGDEPEFENHLDLDLDLDLDFDFDHEDAPELDSEDELELDFDFDTDVETETELELEDVNVETDFDAGVNESDLKEDSTVEDSAVEDSTELDFFPGKDSESGDNFDAEAGVDSDFDFDFDSDFESGLDLDFDTDFELEFDDDKDVNEFDEKTEFVDGSENRDVTEGLKNAKNVDLTKDADLTTEENFEIELDFQNDDEPGDDFEIDESETKSSDAYFQGGDVSGEDGDLELDFSEFDHNFDKQSKTSFPAHDEMEKVSTDEKNGLETGEEEYLPMDEHLPVDEHLSTDEQPPKDEQLPKDKDENIEKSASGLILSDSIPPDSTNAAVDTEQEKIPEHGESDKEVSLDAVPEGFEIDDELEKPVKRPGKAVFVILFLAIIILAGYSITIMQGINIPYVSNFKIPFITRYLKPNTPVKSFPVRLIPDKKSINGRFVTNSSAGTLFVITGRVINKSAIPCSHVRVTGTLITKNKVKVKIKTVFCGNLVSEDKLGSLTMEAIDSILARKSGNNSSNVNIAPDRFVPFMIVFSKLPDNLQNFTVNVAGFDKGNIKK